MGNRAAIRTSKEGDSSLNGRIIECDHCGSHYDDRMWQQCPHCDGEEKELWKDDALEKAHIALSDKETEQ